MRILQHSAVLVDSDSEETRLTSIAREDALPGLESLGVDTAVFQLVESRMPVGLHAVELHGQSSVTAHGQQGLRPSRLRKLRLLDAVGVPVFLGFCDGRAKWWSGWLRELPEAHAIRHGDAGDPESARYGWWCRDFPDHGELLVPMTPPVEYRTPTQGALI